jgi:hypothetical protein
MPNAGNKRNNDPMHGLTFCPDPMHELTFCPDLKREELSRQPGRYVIDKSRHLTCFLPPADPPQAENERDARFTFFG